MTVTAFVLGPVSAQPSRAARQVATQGSSLMACEAVSEKKRALAEGLSVLHLTPCVAYGESSVLEREEGYKLHGRFPQGLVSSKRSDKMIPVMLPSRALGHLPRTLSLASQSARLDRDAGGRRPGNPLLETKTSSRGPYT